MFEVKIMWVKEHLQNTDNGAHFVSSERHSNGKWQKKRGKKAKKQMEKELK